MGKSSRASFGALYLRFGSLLAVILVLDVWLVWNILEDHGSFSNAMRSSYVKEEGLPNDRSLGSNEFLDTEPVIDVIPEVPTISSTVSEEEDPITKTTIPERRVLSSALQCDSSQLQLCTAMFYALRAASTRTVFDLDCSLHQHWWPKVADAMKKYEQPIELSCTEQGERLSSANMDTQVSSIPEGVDIVIAMESISAADERTTWTFLEKLHLINVSYVFLISTGSQDQGEGAPQVRYRSTPFNFPFAHFEMSETPGNHTYHLFAVEEIWFDMYRRDFCDILGGVDCRENVKFRRGHSPSQVEPTQIFSQVM